MAIQKKMIWGRAVAADVSGAVDPAGNSYVTGQTSGSLGGISNGGIDIFILKLDPSGNVVWKRQYGTSEEEKGWAIAYGQDGHIYVTGTERTIVSYDSDGNQRYAVNYMVNYRDISYGVTADSSGNAYITGGTDGTIVGYDDLFLQKVGGDCQQP